MNPFEKFFNPVVKLYRNPITYSVMMFLSILCVIVSFVVGLAFSASEIEVHKDIGGSILGMLPASILLSMLVHRFTQVDYKTYGKIKEYLEKNPHLTREFMMVFGEKKWVREREYKMHLKELVEPTPQPYHIRVFHSLEDLDTDP